MAVETRATLKNGIDSEIADFAENVPADVRGELKDIADSALNRAQNDNLLDDVELQFGTGSDFSIVFDPTSGEWRFRDKQGNTDILVVSAAEIVVGEDDRDLRFTAAGIDNVFTARASDGHIGIGTAPEDNVQLTEDAPAETLDANVSFARHATRNTHALTIQGSTTSPQVSAYEIQPPNLDVSATAAVVTEAMTLHITGAPSAGDTNYGALIEAGDVALQSDGQRLLLGANDEVGIAYEAAPDVLDVTGKDVRFSAVTGTPTFGGHDHSSGGMTQIGSGGIATDAVKVDEIDQTIDPDWFGSHDFSSATLILPTATVSSVSEGVVLWQSDTDKLHVGTGGSVKVMVDEDRTLTGGHGIQPLGDLSADRTVAVAPADFTGSGLTTSGTPANIDVGAGTGITVNASDVELDSTVLVDGGAKELDVADLAGGSGTSGQVPQSDGAAVTWVTLASGDLSDFDEAAQDAVGLNFGAGLSYDDATPNFTFDESYAATITSGWAWDTGAGANLQVDETGVYYSTANAETLNFRNTGTGSVTVQQDGTAVVLETRSLTGGNAIDAIGDLSTDRTIAVSTGGIDTAEIATDAVGNSELDNADAFTFNGDLTLGQPNTDYVIGDRSEFLTIQAQKSGQTPIWEFYTADGDGTDDLRLRLVASGTPGAFSDAETIDLRYDSANARYELSTVSLGTGNHHPLHVGSGGNTNQLVAATSGNVNMESGTLGVNTGVGSQDTSFDLHVGANGILSAGAVEVNGTTPLYRFDDGSGNETKLQNQFEGSVGDTNKVALQSISGLVIVINSTDGEIATFEFDAVNNAVTEINDPSGNFTTTEDNDTTANVYWDSTATEFQLNNELGGPIDFRIMYIGS